MNEYYQLRTAGFSDAEITGDMRRKYLSAGFTDQEANAEIQQQMISPDQRAYDLLNKPNLALLDYFGQAFVKAQSMPAPEPKAQADPYANQLGGSDAAIVDPDKMPAGNYQDVTLAPEATTAQAFQAGFQGSVTGLAAGYVQGKARGETSVMGFTTPAGLPQGPLTPGQVEDLTHADRITMQAGALAGDLPAMFLGALAGGAQGGVPAAAGAFAMPAALRSILMAEYEQGRIQTPQEFVQRGAVAMLEAAKGGAVGAATYGAGVAAKAGAPILSVPVEVAAMVTAGAAVEGEMPKARDFIDAGVLIAGMRLAGAAGPAISRATQDVAPKLRSLYAKTGIRPDKVLEDVKSDPSIAHDLLGVDGPKVPTAYAGRESLMAAAPTQKVVFDTNRPVAPAGPVGMDGVTKISDVVKLLEDKMGTPIRTGGFRENAAGIYRTGDKVIRTEIANNISVIAHEVGHDLQKTLFGAVTDRPLEPWRKELEAIATKPAAGGSVLGEGFAEFVARYVVDPKSAEQVAPGFFKSFEKSMDMTAPDIKAVLVQAQGMVQMWKEQPAIMRVLSHISTGEKEPGLLERAVDPQTWNTLYTRTVDRLHPIAQIVKEGLRPGEVLPSDLDPYNIARRFSGSTGAATSFIESQPFRFADKQPVGKSLKAALEGVENLDEFRAYLISKSQLERGERGMLSPGFTEDAKAVVEHYGPKYEQAAQDLYAFKNNVLDYVRDSGVYSAETVQAWRDAWKNHVSFSRVMDAASGIGGTGKSLQAAKTIKKAKGSGRDIIDPLESTIEDAYRLLNMAERNRVVESFVHFSETHEGLGKWIEKVPDPMKSVKVRTDEILKAVEEYDLGASVHAAVLFEKADLATTIFRPDSYLDKTNQIALFRDGKRSVYQVDPELANVVHNLDGQSMNMLVRILAVPARVLRVGATTTPPFLIMNAVKDSFSTGVYSPGFIPIVDTVRGIFAMAKNDKLYRQWVEDGGEQFAMVGMDRASLQKNLETLTGTGVTSTLTNVVKHPIEMLRVMGEWSEGGTRVGAYMKDRRKLGDSMAARAEAAFKSRDLMDFARRGGDPGVQQFSQMTAFWNARIQGTDKMIRAFKEDPIGMTARATAIYTVPSVLLAISNFVSEPREEQDRVWGKAALGQELTPVEHDLYMRMQIAELPNWRKDLFWNVRAGDFIFPIPKGFELGILFATVPERVTNWMLGYVHKNGTGEEFDGLTKTILGGVSPAGLPTALGVPMELWANKSILFDRAIVPAQREGMLPELQYTPNTTQTMRELSRVIGALPNMREYTFSPARAEHLIRGWTGGLGNYALRATDWALRSTGVVPNPTRPDLKLSDVPAVQSFVVRYPSTGTETIAKFYDRYAKSQAYVKSIAGMQKEFRFEDAARLTGESGFNVMQGAYQAMSAMQAAVHNINDNPTLDGTKKRELIDSLYLQMNTVARHGNDVYKRVQETMKAREEATQ